MARFVASYHAIRRPAAHNDLQNDLIEECTSRKQGFGPGLSSPLAPVQSRTGTNGGTGPGSLAQGAGRATWAIGPGSFGTFGPGWSDKPRPMALGPGPPPLVPVIDMNRDQRLPFSPGS